MLLSVRTLDRIGTQMKEHGIYSLLGVLTKLGSHEVEHQLLHLEYLHSLKSIAAVEVIPPGDERLLYYHM
jgi:hypothetical protein